MKNSSRFFENKDCEYFPCHKGVESFNCLFCYCPFYTRSDCPGSPSFIQKNGRSIKDCTNCTFPHKPENYDKIMAELKKH